MLGSKASSRLDLLTTLIFHTLTSASLLLSLLVSSADPSDSEPADSVASDIQRIKKTLPDFQRPDFKQIPYLIQRVSHDEGKTDYLLPPEEPGQLNAKVAFSRQTLDTHLSVIVFPTGTYGWSKAIGNKYVALRRHSRKTPVYFLTYAYVRRQGSQRNIEWSIEELQTHAPKSRMEFEICRGEECDLQEWILGTCTIVSHSCTINITEAENETIHRPLKAEEEDDTSIDTLLSESNESDSSAVGDDDDSEDDDDLERRRKRDTSGSDYFKHFPNTFDLIIPHNMTYDFRLRREKRSSPQSLDHNVEEMLHVLKCRNCKKLGEFYQDLEEEVGFNAILGEKFLLQYNETKQRHWRRFPWMRRASEVPYIGYGDCTYMSVEPELKKPISNEMDDVIDFYLSTLRLDCNAGLKNEIRGWLTSKWRFLRIVQDLSFELIPSSMLLQYSMLTPKEFETIANAILFLKYSSVYREAEASSKNSFRITLLGHPLSTKVSFLTRVIIKVIDLTNHFLQHHLIKMSRVLARILKDKFYALLLEKKFIPLKKRPRQEHLNKENYRDRIQIMALKEFLLYGLSPIFRSGSSTDVAFNSFYQMNENRIRFLVHSYGFDEANNES